MRYRSGVAFRKALEDRLNVETTDRPEMLVRLRKIVTFERFLARIQSSGDDRWLLKGGFALQLRMWNRARTTRDVDLSANIGVFETSNLSAEHIGKFLSQSCDTDLGDFFTYQVGTFKEIALEAGPVRAYRYPVRSLLAGKTFENFHVDAGVGDPLVAPAVNLAPTGHLDFAELPPVKFRAITSEQHFAEKVHALTRPREGRENSRTRDLADIMLLLDLGLPDPPAVRAAVVGIFHVRQTHDVPITLDDPPESWATDYPVLAGELGLNQTTVEEAMTRLRDYWRDLAWREK